MKEYIQQLSPDKLVPFQNHPYQVREDAALSELMESIRTHGVLSPLLARPKGESYELVSGHRRRLAAQKLALPTVPVLVREMTDDEAVILNFFSPMNHRFAYLNDLLSKYSVIKHPEMQIEIPLLINLLLSKGAPIGKYMMQSQRQKR